MQSRTSRSWRARPNGSTLKGIDIDAHGEVGKSVVDEIADAWPSSGVRGRTRMLPASLLADPLQNYRSIAKTKKNSSIVTLVIAKNGLKVRKQNPKYYLTRIKRPARPRNAH